ncbi:MULTISPECIES: nucleotide disphospho-sugar-binding domain-containing protein [unclassified Mycobacterium]|uniref:nucleotide disphospho-sugar-binding domain-containing protein n=1 Tax=unclassified Mycobacterium TaxID=2642494 RepID=UPI0007400BE0|nr:MULTISPECIES: nucleotide disphospho-sugar-binding domain-containing protein [unclassified Mycobacterium]KUH82830.1 glycosyl transferase [Mycobacterium sp. IS-1556]KUH83389.1 glycosyl transferase [Mycobacterium sp. GA-0227b]KUH84199.1 glycosyl transferase [Mycobacterium sp. GA-1999]
MATILAYTSPAFGNLYPLLALLVEMRNRGHRVVLRTLSEGVGIGGALGLESSALDPRIEAVAMDDWTAANPRAALRAAFRAFAERAVYEVEDLAASIESVCPDATIIDSNCWGAPAVVDAASMPWALFWSYPPILRSRKAPPFGPGLRPWPGPLGRLRDEALRPLVAGTFDRAMREPLNRVCAQVGAKSVVSGQDLVSRAPLILVATAEPFEYSHPDWDDRVQMIGPCEFDVPDDVSFLDGIDRPIVLVATSSERQADAVLPSTALAAMSTRPVHVIATFPCGVPDGLVIPDNATVRTFVAHGAVLDRAVCAVTHGGMGVTQKALARGVPVCVVPFGRDQFEVARRVEVARCGSRLPSRKLTAPRLRRKIDEAMTRVDGARRVAAGFASAGGVARGADLVERRLLEFDPTP